MNKKNTYLQKNKTQQLDRETKLSSWDIPNGVACAQCRGNH